MPILDKDKKPVISIMMHEDITEKLNYQNELIALHDEFYERVDEEKKGVSEKLHDIVGQELVGIRNIIDNMTLYDLPEEVGKSINKAYHALNNLIDLVKDLTDKIRPPLPDKVSMSEATQWYIRDVAEKSEIIFESRIEKNIILSEKSTEKLYGILREGVGNALKYSKAKRIKIDLYREKNRIVLKIQDDGIGIEKGLAESNKSLGLRITKERVRTMGGKITIKGEKNKGTLLEIDLPLKNNV
jgi:signal transduction histidine kinase